MTYEQLKKDEAVRVYISQADAAMEALLHARHIYVAGMRSAMPLAQFLLPPIPVLAQQKTLRAKTNVLKQQLNL